MRSVARKKTKNEPAEQLQQCDISAAVCCRALLYVVVQSVGALAGAGILKGLSANGTNDGLCMTKPSDGVTLEEVFGIETVITFVLVFTVFATCDSLRTGFGGSGPLAIGLSISMCHLWAVRSYYNNNNNNNTHDNVYSAVILTTGHCESSLGSFDECRPAPSSRRPSDQAI